MNYTNKTKTKQTNALGACGPVDRALQWTQDQKVWGSIPCASNV